MFVPESVRVMVCERECGADAADEVGDADRRISDDEEFGSGEDKITGGNLRPKDDGGDGEHSKAVGVNVEKSPLRHGRPNVRMCESERLLRFCRRWQPTAARSVHVD